MAILINPQRGGGHDGIAYYGLETGPLPDGATAMPVLPAAMNLLPLSSAPGVEGPENPMPRRSVGSARRLGKDKPGRREPTMNGGFMLSAAAASLALIRFALRYDTTTLAASRWEGLPLFALATGLAGRVDTTLIDQEVGRFCVMESVQIAWADGQDTRVTFKARALTLVSSNAFTNPTEAAIITAGGDPFNSAELYCTKTLAGVAGGGLDNVFNSITLTINNPIALSGTRHPDYVNGLSNPLASIAYFFEVGDEDISLEVNTKARLDAFDAASLINQNANGYLGFILGGLSRQSRGRAEVQPNARAGFSNAFTVATVDLTLV